MKTITNIKRRAKNSIKQRKQRKYKTHKNKHTKTQLKQYKTHRGGAEQPVGPPKVNELNSSGFTKLLETSESDNASDTGTGTPNVVNYSDTDDDGPYGFICDDIFNISKIKKDGINEIDLNTLLNSTESTESSKINNYNRDHLLALFMTLAISIESKQLCMLNLIVLDNQYYNRLMDTNTYNMGIEGMHLHKKKFNKLIEDVILRNVYTPFNGTEKDIKINNLKEWIEVIQMLFGFEAQYKQYLSMGNLNPKQKKRTLDSLKKHCATVKKIKKCIPAGKNPCCNINRETI